MIKHVQAFCDFYYKNIDSAYGISSSNSTAVDVGMKVLKSGGNAIDAAAAISYVLGVVEPYSSGIGGGGCMLIYFPETKDYKFYNYREYIIYIPYSLKIGLSSKLNKFIYFISRLYLFLVLIKEVSNYKGERYASYTGKSKSKRYTRESI